MSSPPLTTILNDILSPSLYTTYESLTSTLNPSELRTLSMNLVTSLTKPPHSDTLPNIPHDNLATLTACLSQIGNSLTDGSDNALRRKIYQLYIDSGSFSLAGEVLSSLRVDPSLPAYTFTPSEVLDLNVTSAECYLEDGDAISAEVFVSKAASVVADAPEGNTEVLRFRSTQARVLDAQRKFLQASEFYYLLSQSTHPSVHPPDLLLLLGKACTTAVLGKSCTRRSKILALLSSDERLPRLSSIPGYESHPSTVLRMHRLELLDTADVSAFHASLEDHQKARLADGRTVLERAVMEHNVVALERVYTSVSLKQVGEVLQVKGGASSAVKVVAGMIKGGAVEGRIDQVKGIVVFGEGERDGKVREERIGRDCMGCNDIENRIRGEREGK
jgi:COP9 signalosome complex subunit 4